MGTWSEEPFGNDTAADWALELDGAESWNFVEEALRNGLLDADPSESELEIAVAATETVAHGLGRPTQDDVYTESVAAFAARVGAPPETTIELAKRALTALAKDSSPIAELWASKSDIEEWRDALRVIHIAIDV